MKDSNENNGARFGMAQSAIRYAVRSEGDTRGLLSCDSDESMRPKTKLLCTRRHVGVNGEGASVYIIDENMNRVIESRRRKLST